MARRRVDELCRLAASQTGLGVGQVRGAVSAWFGALDTRVRGLRFCDVGRLYTAGRFKADGFVVNVPHLGRIGTAYSKYAEWRREALSGVGVVNLRGAVKAERRTAAEAMAEAALRGEVVTPRKVGRAPEGYRRVVVMDVGGTHVGSQAVPVTRDGKHSNNKGKGNVQD